VRHPDDGNNRDGGGELLVNCDSHRRRPPIPHHCGSCGRLLGLQPGSSLHVKRKDFEGRFEAARANLRCRCGVVTVVVTVPCVPS
jgi:hypothetical protein